MAARSPCSGGLGNATWRNLGGKQEEAEEEQWGASNQSLQLMHVTLGRQAGQRLGEEYIFLIFQFFKNPGVTSHLKIMSHLGGVGHPF